MIRDRFGEFWKFLEGSGLKAARKLAPVRIHSSNPQSTKSMSAPSHSARRGVFVLAPDRRFLHTVREALRLRFGRRVRRAAPPRAVAERKVFVAEHRVCWLLPGRGAALVSRQVAGRREGCVAGCTAVGVDAGVGARGNERAPCVDASTRPGLSFVLRFAGSGSCVGRRRRWLSCLSHAFHAGEAEC